MAPSAPACGRRRRTWPCSVPRASSCSASFRYRSRSVQCVAAERTLRPWNAIQRAAKVTRVQLATAQSPRAAIRSHGTATPAVPQPPIHECTSRLLLPDVSPNDDEETERERRGLHNNQHWREKESSQLYPGPAAMWYFLANLHHFTGPREMVEPGYCEAVETFPPVVGPESVSLSLFALSFPLVPSRSLWCGST